MSSLSNHGSAPDSPQDVAVTLVQPEAVGERIGRNVDLLEGVSPRLFKVQPVLKIPKFLR
jgi:hypothetical protein